MPGPYPPINPRFPFFLHGGDYNPEQWPSDVWDEDMRLMKVANANAMTVGVFSWVSLEPSEGEYTFEWLDTIMDKLAENGACAILATPTAAQPAWMSAKYPEILKTGADRRRNLHGNRVNTCWTSPIYREKCFGIAQKLALRYKDHPALAAWHIFNEYGGECYCELCTQAFREWLQKKYQSLDALNQAYWTRFWGHTYTEWSQIEAPGGPYGEGSILGLTLDWQRFTSDQIIACMSNEISAIRPITPNTPITTNMMGTYDGIDYWKMAEKLDVVSWDSYPRHGSKELTERQWMRDSFIHDIYRTFKGGKPFMLMEHTPSVSNWHAYQNLKRPNLHVLNGMQAVAHGSDTVQYFQWRQSRGSIEKFHSAVVGHNCDENAHIFKNVARIGEIVSKLGDVVGTVKPAEVAIIYDWENGWAIKNSAGPRFGDKGYGDACLDAYRYFWSNGIGVEVPNMDGDLSKYKLVIAPMLYMVRPGVAERIREFVAGGGTFVMTYWSGIVDENDLCFLGGRPGPLSDVMGVYVEEMDVLFPGMSNRVVASEGNSLGLSGAFDVSEYADIMHARGAEVLGTFESDFYGKMPALTVNSFGKGKAYYIGAKLEDAFGASFYGAIASELGLRKVLAAEIPTGVTAQLRTDGTTDFVFVLNFNDFACEVSLGETGLVDVLTGEACCCTLALEPYGGVVLKRPAK